VATGAEGVEHACAREAVGECGRVGRGKSVADGIAHNLGPAGHGAGVPVAVALAERPFFAGPVDRPKHEPHVGDVLDCAVGPIATSRGGSDTGAAKPESMAMVAPADVPRLALSPSSASHDRRIPSWSGRSRMVVESSAVAPVISASSKKRNVSTACDAHAPIQPPPAER
jgi:hypothetical protein